jgi:very-short-patch-repair endonuclease
MHKAAYRRRLNMKKVEVVAARYPTRRGHASLVRAIKLYRSGSVGTRSKLEETFLQLLADSEIPTPLVNTRVPIAMGSLEVDCYWPTHRLCVEIDGGGHLRPRTIREDKERDRQLRATGLRVIRFTGENIQRFPREVIAKLHTELQRMRINS